MVTVTLKQLQVEGRLQRGDIITHSVTGDHTVMYIRDDKSVAVKDAAGAYHYWTLNLGADARIETRARA